MFLAILKLPTDSDAIARATEAAGLPLADTRQRLAGTPPRIFLTHGDEAHLRQTAEALNAGGFTAALVDPARIPGDSQRLIPKRLEFAVGRLALFTADGARHELPAAAIRFIQRGRREGADRVVHSKELKFSPVKAVLTQGLLLTKTVDKTTTVAGAHEHCLLLQRNDGGPEIILYEKGLDYGFLTTDKQPGSLANLDRTLLRLHALAPAAGYSAQSLQPGWLASLSAPGLNAQDLAFYLLGMAGAGV